MSLEEFKSKYAPNEKITSNNNLQIGDNIAFFNEILDRELVGIVVSISWLSNFVVTVKIPEMKNLMFEHSLDNLTFKLSSQVIVKPGCSCGAKHTSNKTYHLSFCDIV